MMPPLYLGHLNHLSNSISPEGGPHSVRVYQFMGEAFLTILQKTCRMTLWTGTRTLDDLEYAD